MLGSERDVALRKDPYFGLQRLAFLEKLVQPFAFLRILGQPLRLGAIGFDLFFRGLARRRGHAGLRGKQQFKLISRQIDRVTTDVFRLIDGEVWGSRGRPLKPGLTGQSCFPPNPRGSTREAAYEAPWRPDRPCLEVG